MSYHVHLMYAKDCLVAGQMTEMRVCLRRAGATATTEAEAQEVRTWALRCCLLTGQYELGQQLLLDVERHESGLPGITGPLREALFSAAGWGPQPAEAPGDFFALITNLVQDQSLIPEEALIKLGAWSRLVPRHPLWMDELARCPFPQEVWKGLGERILPANAEAAIAELWYGAGGHGEYPRRVLLEQNEAENGFAFLPAFCDLLLFLQQGDVHSALAASDRLFPNEGAWLWLRALDLIRHFGDPALLARTPLRLRIARRTLHASHSDSAGSFTADAYGPLVHSFTQTISRCQPPCVPALTPDEDGTLLADAGKALEEMFLTSSEASAPWFAAPGACLMVSRLLDSCQADVLPARPAFPDLLPLHEFVRSAVLAERASADLWLALPPVWWTKPEYFTLLLKALPVAQEDVALSCALTLQEQGVAADLILHTLPSGAQASVFLRGPKPTGLIMAASLPEEVLHDKWIALAESAWALGGQQLEVSERAAQETLVRRLTACLDSPDVPPLAAESFMALTAQALVRQAASEAEAQLLCWLGLRLADAEQWNEAAQVLKQAGEIGVPVRGEALAQQWLKTGQAEAYQPEAWHASGPWGEMAWAWSDLLDMRPARLSETNPLRVKASELANAWDGLAGWREACLTSDMLKTFPISLLLDDIVERWRFLRSPRSWRLLTSSANVLPPITGLTAGPDRPLLALISLSRFGTDAAAIRAVLPSLLKVEPLPLLALGLLEQSLKAAETSELLRRELRFLLAPEVTDALNALLPGHPLRSRKMLDALLFSLASPEAQKLLRLNQTKATEKQCRLALQKVETADFEITSVLEKIGDFVTGPHFRAWSLLQWAVIRKWRHGLEVQDESFRERVRKAVPEKYSQVLIRLLIEPLHPILIDGSNLLRDKSTSQQSEWTTDCLERLWASLAERYYPIITYVDSNEFAKQDEEHGPAAKHRLNDLIRNGFIDDDTIIENGPAEPAMSNIGDYRILCCIESESWQESAIIVTNDIYSKQPQKQGDIHWPRLFPWLTKSLFHEMQAGFRFQDGEWLLRLPGGTEVLF